MPSDYWKNPETRLRLITKAAKWNKDNRQRHNEIAKKNRDKYPEKRKEYARSWRERNPEKLLDQKYRKYGIVYADYVALYAKQKGLCAICNEPPTEKLLSVDHDHVTGKVRGLLHRSCNSALGILGDSVEGLEKAIKYLKENS